MRYRVIHRARCMRPARRGAALLAFVAALLVIGTLLLWLFQVTSTSTSASLGHYFSTGAFYAAESGVEMSAREIGLGQDVDNDSNGTPGTISNNGDPEDDPVIGTGAFMVERVSDTPPVYRAIGRPVVADAPWSGFRRMIEYRTQ